MKVGVSTACLYPMETEKALETLGKQGIETVELFFNAPSELDPTFLAGLRAVTQRYHMQVAAVHPYSSGFEPFLFFTNYGRRFRDALKMYESFYNAANVLGAPIVALHGDRREGLLPEQAYFERYGEMFHHAKKHGILLAQENVERCRSRDAGFIARMRACLGGDVRFILDLKQAVRSGETPFTMLEAMGGALCHLHLSDTLATEDCLPPGVGEFNFAALWKCVSPLGEGICGVVELYRQNYGTVADLYKSYSFLKAIR